MLSFENSSLLVSPSVCNPSKLISASATLFLSSSCAACLSRKTISLFNYLDPMTSGIQNLAIRSGLLYNSSRKGFLIWAVLLFIPRFLSVLFQPDAPILLHRRVSSNHSDPESTISGYVDKVFNIIIRNKFVIWFLRLIFQFLRSVNRFPSSHGKLILWDEVPLWRITSWNWRVKVRRWKIVCLSVYCWGRFTVCIGFRLHLTHSLVTRPAFKEYNAPI